jgi:GTP-binding protein
MVRLDDGRDFVMADLPGIIEGAHEGAGLGLQFLRHIERCKVIVHIIDMASVDGRDPISDYHIIQNELKEYKMNLSKRPTILVANKMDLPGAKENLERFKKEVSSDIYPISAYTKDNLKELLYKIKDTIDHTEAFSLFEEDELDVVEYTLQEEKKPFTIEKQDDGVFNVTGAKLKRAFDMTDFDSETARFRFARQLREYGLDDALRKRGVKNGDTVRIFDFEFEFIE